MNPAVSLDPESHPSMSLIEFRDEVFSIGETYRLEMLRANEIMRTSGFAESEQSRSKVDAHCTCLAEFVVNAWSNVDDRQDYESESGSSTNPYSSLNAFLKEMMTRAICYRDAVLRYHGRDRLALSHNIACADVSDKFIALLHLFNHSLTWSEGRLTLPPPISKSHT